jgi:hypothetical protein
MDKTVDKALSWIYDPSSGAAKAEDYLLGKAVDANFERGTLGQINAVEYGKSLIITHLYFLLNETQP